MCHDRNAAGNLLARLSYRAVKRAPAPSASWHVQLGTPLYVLKELGGWETLEMVNRYAHLPPNT